MSNNSNWKRQLQRVIHLHGAAGGGNGGRIGALAVGLFLIFGHLRRLGFQPDPLNIGGRHVRALLWYWTCDARIEPWCRQRRIEMLREPYNARYIASLLRDLGTFCEWIGKPGLVLPIAQELRSSDHTADQNRASPVLERQGD